MGGENTVPPILTSALDGGEWSASRPDRFIPDERGLWYFCDIFICSLSRLIYCVVYVNKYRSFPLYSLFDHSSRDTFFAWFPPYRDMFFNVYRTYPESSLLFLICISYVPLVPSFIYTCDKIETKCNVKQITKLTNFMELSPSWEAASCAATQKFPNNL
jgi:hypothetical protein